MSLLQIPMSSAGRPRIRGEDTSGPAGRRIVDVCWDVKAGWDSTATDCYRDVAPGGHHGAGRKPQIHSFVYDVRGDPAIFLYLDPEQPPAQFENTVAHELHHIGFRQHRIRVEGGLGGPLRRDPRGRFQKRDTNKYMKV
jgi:hypothetical protein